MLESSRTLRRGLYAIVDVTSVASRELDPLAFAQAVLVARPAALQIRAKGVDAREFVRILRAAAALCRAAGVPLVANDRVDLALEVGCDYVHVGQEDMPVDQIRALAPSLHVGVSTHTPLQLAAALAAAPDYVAYGPVFPTASKAHPDPCVGLDGLASAFATTGRTPLVAIGGVTLERAPEVAERAHAAAVIHALLPGRHGSSADEQARYREVTQRAVALHAALGGAA